MAFGLTPAMPLEPTRAERKVEEARLREQRRGWRRAICLGAPPRPCGRGGARTGLDYFRPGARSDGLPVVSRQFEAPGLPMWTVLPPSDCPGAAPL